VTITTLFVFFLQFFFNSFLDNFIYGELLLLFFLIVNKKQTLAHYSAFGYGFLMDIVSNFVPFGVFAVSHLAISIILERSIKMFVNVKDSRIAPFFIFTACVIYGFSIGIVIYITTNIFTPTEFKLIQAINPKTILTNSLLTFVFAFLAILSKNTIKKAFGKWFFIK